MVGDSKHHTESKGCQRLLPREERRVYEAYYLEEKTPYAIAVELQRHLTTVNRCIERLSAKLERLTGKPHLQRQPYARYRHYINDVAPDLPDEKQKPPTRRARYDHDRTQRARALLQEYVLRDSARNPLDHRILEVPKLSTILYTGSSIPPGTLHPHFFDEVLRAYTEGPPVRGSVLMESITYLRKRFDDLPKTHGVTDLPVISQTTFHKIITRLREEHQAQPFDRKRRKPQSARANVLPFLYLWEITAESGETVYYIGIAKGIALRNAQQGLICRGDDRTLVMSHRRRLDEQLSAAGLLPASCACEMIVYWPISPEGKRGYTRNHPAARALAEVLRCELQDAGRRVIHVASDIS